MSCLDQFTTLIFDMDGVLFFSSEAHGAAYDRTFKAYGYAGLPYAEIAGVRTDDAFRKVLFNEDVVESDALIEELTVTKRKWAGLLLREAPPVVPNCRFILEQLQERFTLGLASSASKDTVDLFLDASETRDLFRSVLSGQDVENSKPSPEIFVKAMQKLNIEPESVAIIEDSVAGVIAGRRAGATVIGVRGTVDDSVLRANGAKYIVSGIRDLLDL
ncbi:MAG: HAD family phosphatase [Methylococcaceae bacterium]|nr:HAD family phosphatase [Methylococcaceae bacterium]